MMQASTFQSIKLAIVGTTGLAKDALHVYVGLAVFLAVCVLLRRPMGSRWPLLAALAVAVLGELFDLRDDLVSMGIWHWRASVHDLLNTLFWPAVLCLLARWTSLARRG